MTKSTRELLYKTACESTKPQSYIVLKLELLCCNHNQSTLVTRFAGVDGHHGDSTLDLAYHHTTQRCHTSRLATSRQREKSHVVLTFAPILSSPTCENCPILSKGVTSSR
ncbi:hypothetical protein PoB_005494200 [Plakobranchus ocellatus]|uniref:Uncharacterized protein n=1 Tax=Plakobranchus ocellatus TaxID=259542 RepID=A0AAV4CA60_9GAST|nr:hypothetical protein PoB_005494200 [Plakobranchus ocellatus]